ncbi:MAG: hypothetical protein AAGH41_06235 [Pseudomonadota bacterium]
MKPILQLAVLVLAGVACGEKTATAQSNIRQPADIITEAAGERDAFLPDFSYAGYGFGIDPIPKLSGTIISPRDFGAIPNDEIDDSQALKDALEKARETAGPVIIRFEPGRYQLTEVLDLDRSDLVLQGAGRGRGGTEIFMPRPLAMVDTGTRFNELRTYLSKYTKRQREPLRNLNVLFSEYSWTGGFFWIGKPGARAVPYLEEQDQKTQPVTVGRSGARGGKTLSVRDPGSFEPGQWIEILWYSDNPESGLIDSIYGPTDLKIGSHHWTFADRPLVRHRTKITNIQGETLGLASPLPHPVSDRVPAEIALWAPLERIGIEDLRFTFPNSPSFGHHVERGYNAVYLTGATDSWIRNIEITNQDAGILTDDSVHVTISDLIFSGNRPGHYAVHMGSVENVLVQNIDIFSPMIHSLTFNTKSLRSVYKNATVRAKAVIDQHAGSNHQNLFDNITLHLTANRGEDGPSYPVFDGSGAPYWQPGHGRYNTVWNLKLIVEGGMAADETLSVLGTAEGPDARIVGLHGNRPLTLDYRPEPVVAHLNERVTEIPSLYDFQLQQRRAREE